MIKGTKIFKVTIDGQAVDPKPYNQYDDFNSENPSGTEEDYTNKAKALYRWYLMSMNLNKGLDTLSNIKAEADSKTVPSNVEFYLTYTQPDALWIRKDGEVITNGLEVIKTIIEDTLSASYEEGCFAPQFNPNPSEPSPQDIYTSKLPLGESFKGIVVDGVEPTIVVEEVREYKQFD